MCAQASTKKDQPTAVVTPRMPWRVSTVEVLKDFKLRVRFLDGTEGVVEMDALVHSADAGVFAELSGPERFAEAYVEHGAVTWPGEIDLAPDAMYRAIKDTGVWILA
jgi:hypothetical protein